MLNLFYINLTLGMKDLSLKQPIIIIDKSIDALEDL